MSKKRAREDGGLERLRHSSALQRFEWLGDAVLVEVITRLLWKASLRLPSPTRNSDTPGWGISVPSTADSKGGSASSREGEALSRRIKLAVDGSVTNKNLALVYWDRIPQLAQWLGLNPKFKAKRGADFVEAVVGESFMRGHRSSLVDGILASALSSFQQEDWTGDTAACPHTRPSAFQVLPVDEGGADGSQGVSESSESCLGIHQPTTADPKPSPSPSPLGGLSGGKSLGDDLVCSSGDTEDESAAEGKGLSQQSQVEAALLGFPQEDGLSKVKDSLSTQVVESSSGVGESSCAGESSSGAGESSSGAVNDRAVIAGMAGRAVLHLAVSTQLFCVHSNLDPSGLTRMRQKHMTPHRENAAAEALGYDERRILRVALGHLALAEKGSGWQLSGKAAALMLGRAAPDPSQANLWDLKELPEASRSAARLLGVPQEKKVSQKQKRSRSDAGSSPKKRKVHPPKRSKELKEAHNLLGRLSRDQAMLLLWEILNGFVAECQAGEATGKVAALVRSDRAASIELVSQPQLAEVDQEEQVLRLPLPSPYHRKVLHSLCLAYGLSSRSVNLSESGETKAVQVAPSSEGLPESLKPLEDILAVSPSAHVEDFIML